MASLSNPTTLPSGITVGDDGQTQLPDGTQVGAGSGFAQQLLQRMLQGMGGAQPPAQSATQPPTPTASDNAIAAIRQQMSDMAAWQQATGEFAPQSSYGMNYGQSLSNYGVNYGQDMGKHLGAALASLLRRQ